MLVRGIAHGRHWQPSSSPAIQPLPLGMKETQKWYSISS